MDPHTEDLHTEDLHQQIARLTAENARLRSELAVVRLWDPPPALEHAFQDARGWECLSVPMTADSLTLILIAGPSRGDPQDAHAAEEAAEEAAGLVWRYLLTAAPVCGRIGPFARASMPARLLGYVADLDGRALIVLNKNLPRGQLACAARMLRAHAGNRRPPPRPLQMSQGPAAGPVRTAARARRLRPARLSACS